MSIKINLNQMLEINNNLKKENFLNTEKLISKTGVISYRHWFFCKNCKKNKIKILINYYKKASGNCYSCAKKLPEFKAVYNALKSNAKQRNKSFSLSYEEFLSFTKIKNCHYCLSNITWIKFTGKNKIKFNLDRKDNNKGYDFKNCVVCCWKCNDGKSNKFSYEDWYGMCNYFRKNK